MNNFSKIIHFSAPNLACFAPWRELIPLFEYFSSNKVAQAAEILKDSGTKVAKKDFSRQGAKAAAHVLMPVSARKQLNDLDRFR